MRRFRLTDIHCHILPGLDDGAQTMAASLEMLELAAEDGIRTVVATPHVDQRFHPEPDLRRRLAAQISRESLAVLSGCELHVSPENLERLQFAPGDYTIGSSDFVLLEFDSEVNLAVLTNILAVVRAAGLRAIVAHPERNRSFRQRPELADQAVESGAYLQLTAGALTGCFGESVRQSATALLSRGLVHFVASDAHGTLHRKPILSEARMVVERMAGYSAGRLLFDSNPSACLGSGKIRAMNSRLRVRATRWLQTLPGW